MPILVIEHHDRWQAGTLQGRVLIGRWPGNTIVIDDKSVSRIHAWIGVENGAYYVADAGSRGGTLLNGEPLNGRHVLADTDQIQIGPATICYRTDAIPPGMEPIDLSPRSAEALSGEHGQFVECACGAPMWAPRGFSGVGECRYCGRHVAMGAHVTSASKPQQQVAQRGEQSASQHEGAICGVCHTAIGPSDDATPCPSCGLMFHADCWQENRGCSAYGCPEVGALDANRNVSC